MAAKYEESWQFDQNQSQLIDASIVALKECGFKIKGAHYEGGYIDAVAGVNIFSWSENILIDVSPDSVILAKSECAVPFQKVDWGKNSKNVKKFFSKLDKELSGYV